MKLEGRKKGNTFSNKCTLYVTKLTLPTFNKVHLELLPKNFNFTYLVYVAYTCICSIYLKVSFEKKNTNKYCSNYVTNIFSSIQTLPFKGLTDELSTFTRNTLHTMKNIFFSCPKIFYVHFKNLTNLLFQGIHWPKM